MKPIKKNILVRLDDQVEVSKGGIVIPERSKRPEEWGTVVEVGEDCKEVRAGDRVYVEKTQGTRYVHKGKDMIVILEMKVLAMEERKK